MVVALNLPTNGALMTSEQLDELEAHVRAEGSNLEKIMLHQMLVMVYGATAHRLMLETERRCRMAAETRIQNAMRLLATPRSKLNKPDLVKLVKDVLKELEGEHE